MSQARVLGHIVPTAFDGSLSSSRISQTLAVALNVVGKNVSLPVNTDMGSGSFTCIVDLEVVKELHPDVVLGRDWMTYYREYLISEGLVALNSFQCEREERDTGESFVVLSFPTVFIFWAYRERVHHSKLSGSLLPR
jgi:hypothetical protein